MTNWLQNLRVGKHLTVVSEHGHGGGSEKGWLQNHPGAYKSELPPLSLVGGPAGL